MNKEETEVGETTTKLAKRFSRSLFRIIDNQDLNNTQKKIKLEVILNAINSLDQTMKDIDIKRQLNEIFIKYQVELRV